MQLLGCVVGSCHPWSSTAPLSRKQLSIAFDAQGSFSWLGSELLPSLEPHQFLPQVRASDFSSVSDHESETKPPGLCSELGPSVEPHHCFFPAHYSASLRRSPPHHQGVLVRWVLPLAQCCRLLGLCLSPPQSSSAPDAWPPSDSFASSQAGHLVEFLFCASLPMLPWQKNKALPSATARHVPRAGLSQALSSILQYFTGHVPRAGLSQERTCPKHFRGHDRI